MSSSADTQAGDQAEADQLAAQIAAGAVRIHELTQQYDQAQLQAQTIAAHLAVAQQRIRKTRSQVAKSRNLLVRQAISVYTTGTPATEDTSVNANPSLGEEYLRVAVGDVTDTVDQLHVQEQTLHEQEVVLVQDQQASAQAVAAVSDARQAALTQASEEQAQLDTIRGRIAQLVAQAEAQKVAEQEALAAKQAAAQRSTVSRFVLRPTTPTQGLPVNGGLVRTVVGSVDPGTAPELATSGGTGGAWVSLRNCESGGNYGEDTGNGFYGAYQFSQSTWTDLGFPGRPDQAPPSMQDEAAQRLQAESGWGQWPACSAALGLL